MGAWVCIFEVLQTFKLIVCVCVRVRMCVCVRVRARTHADDLHAHPSAPVTYETFIS